MPQEKAVAECISITLEVHEFYERQIVPALLRLSKDKCRPELAPSGYEVLFGPPIVGADILFIGDQPGGGPELGDLEQPANRDPMWPLICDYADARKDYRLATLIRSVLPLHVLTHCSGTERNFFRCSSANVYQSWPYDLRQAAEEFCLERLKRIIGVMLPKNIVFIGKRSMTALIPEHETVLARDDGGFLLARGLYLGTPALGCRHLSGGRLRSGELAEIGEHLQALVGLS